MKNNAHILVTGANGFVGHHLSVHLATRGFRVTQINGPHTHSENSGCDIFVCDLLDRESVFKIFERQNPSHVIHLASLKNRGSVNVNFRESLDLNTAISLNIIEASLATPNLRRFIFLGSCDEYGVADKPFKEGVNELPLSVYGLSKLAITKILLSLHRSLGFPGVILRPSIIYGPKQGNEMFLPSLVRSLLNNNNFYMTEGNQFRDFVYIDDVLDAIELAILPDRHIDGSIINIASGSPIRIRELAEVTASLIPQNLSAKIIYGAIPYRGDEVMNYSVNIDNAQNLLGWHPKTSIKSGVREVISSFGEGPDKLFRR